MTVGKPLEQDPDARLDYPFDWNAKPADGGPYLEPGDSIESCVCRIDPPDPTVTVEDPVTITGDITTAWVVSVSAPAGKRNLIYAIVTTGGRRDQRTRVINIKDQ